MSNVAKAFAQFRQEIEDETQDILTQLGQEAVQYAKENGQYHNVTGRLRASNKYEVKGTTLRVYNDCPYCEEVEARGQDVITDAIIITEQKAKEIFNK